MQCDAAFPRSDAMVRFSGQYLIEQDTREGETAGPLSVHAIECLFNYGKANNLDWAKSNV